MRSAALTAGRPHAPMRTVRRTATDYAVPASRVNCFLSAPWPAAPAQWAIWAAGPAPA
jgi:hypothetical protein